MKTRAQRRAKSALRWKDANFGGKKEGNVLSGFPILIRSDGLLPALAYAIEKKVDKKTKHLEPKNPGEYQIAKALTDYLTAEKIINAKSPEDMVNVLASGDATTLRRATAEALAYLNYLKRFVA